MATPQEQRAMTFAVTTVSRTCGRPLTRNAETYLRGRIQQAWQVADTDGRQDEFYPAVRQLVTRLASAIQSTATGGKPARGDYSSGRAAHHGQSLDQPTVEAGLATVCPLWPFC